jgi:diguanylate cyclase (GGDEF)-like protein/PAS domain S-box-containing protein
LNGERIVYVLLGALAVALLTVSFLSTQTLDSEQHEQINDNLREIRRIDALLNEQVITSRYELQHNYDAIDDYAGTLQELMAALRAGPIVSFGDARGDILRLLAEHADIVTRKVALLEDYKTDNALLKNSLQHLPHGVAALSGNGDASTLALAQDLLRDVLTYNLTGERAVRGDVEREIAALEARTKRVDAVAGTYIANLVSHALLALRLQPQLDGLVAQLLQSPLESINGNLHTAYFSFYKSRVALSDNYRVALYILSTLLLVMIVYIFIRLRANTRELFKEKERALVTLHSIGDAVITTDARGDVVYLNPSAQLITGWSDVEARGEPHARVLQLLDEHSLKPLASLVDRCLGDGRTASLNEHTLLCRRDGQEFAVETTAAPIRDGDNVIIGSVVVIRDVTKTRSMARELQWHASHDPLTGLPNRREFEHRLRVALQGAKERGDAHAVVYLDLDQFKVVNDTCGHVAGDELLRQITGLLQPAVRSVDTLARLGGDEFGLLLEHCSVERARQVADQIRIALKDFRFAWKHKVFSISASIGIAQVMRESNSVDDILSAADMACFAAKDEGRNRVHVYASTDGDIAQRHGEMQWTSRIMHALEENRFRLYVQRIRATRPGGNDENHYELLLRMIDERGEIIPPGAFIPAAERYNLMHAVDRWVVSTVCRQIRQIASRADEVYSINLSGQSLSDDQFLSFVVQELTENRIAAGTICFEITETAAIGSLQNAMKFINTLKARGCRFSLDDFGMGLSSYAYLKNLPVDFLKIDGTFVKDIHDDPADRELVRSVNQIAHVIGIKTIAECVETEAAWTHVHDIGVDYAQGFFVERPRLWLTPVSARNYTTR